MLEKHIWSRLDKIINSFQFKYSLTSSTYTQENFIQNSTCLNLQIKQLFNALIHEHNLEVTSLKKQAKSKRKENQKLTNLYKQNKMQHDTQKKKLQKQIQRCETKINQLLKELSKTQHQINKQMKQKPTDCEIQCELEIFNFDEIVEIYQKQNISLSKIIIQLKQIITENQQQISAGKILINQLIEELQTQQHHQQLTSTISDQTQSEALDSNSERQASSNQQNQRQSELPVQQETIQNSEKQLDQDSSTIADISDLRERDYALPQWMKFDESQKQSQGISIMYEHQEQQDQIWFEILYQKICLKFGWNLY